MDDSLVDPVHSLTSKVRMRWNSDVSNVEFSLGKEGDLIFLPFSPPSEAKHRTYGRIGVVLSGRQSKHSGRYVLTQCSTIQIFMKPDFPFDDGTSYYLC